MNQGINGLKEAVYDGDADKATYWTIWCLNQGMEPRTVLDDGILPAMETINGRLQNHEIYIADIILVSRAVHACFHVLKPLLSQGEELFQAKCIIGTVAGDLHDIGKNIIAVGLTSLGVDVIDLGVDVYPEDFIDAIREHKPDIVALSAMLTTTLSMISETLDYFKAAGLRQDIKVIIGGHPVTEDFCETVHADGWCQDIHRLKSLMDRILA